MSVADRDEKLTEARGRLDELGRQTYTVLKDGAKNGDGQLTGGRLVPVKQAAHFSESEVRHLMALRYSYRTGGWSREGHLLFPTVQYEGRVVPLATMQVAQKALAVLRRCPTAMSLVRAIQMEMTRALAQRRSDAFPLVGVDAQYDNERRDAALGATGCYAYALPSGEVRCEAASGSADATA